MTPKEKAVELISKMQKDFIFIFSKEISKNHALIAVDEIIKVTVDDWSHDDYWQEVKQELINL